MNKRRETGWKCKDCNKNFITKAKLYEHRHQIHKIKSYNRTNICPYCNNHYDGLLKIHKRICNGLHHGHSRLEETKQKISKGLKMWFKNNPDKHPWKRKEKFKSVPCEHLKEILKKDFNFIEEYTDKRWEHNYSIDIAFLDKKIAIEVNGNQHYNEDGTLKEYYQKRHDYLVSLGWIVNEIHYTNCYKEDKIEKIKMAIKESQLISNEEHLILFQNKRKTSLERRKEKIEKFNLAKQNGKLDKTGTKIVANKLVIQEWNKRKELILSSGVDLTKFGWVGKVMKKTGLTIRELEGTITFFSKEFNGKIFRRKGSKELK